MRTKARKITDIAIKKISLVNFDGLTESEKLLVDYINECIKLERSGVQYCATEAIAKILNNSERYGLIYKMGGDGK